MTKPTSLDPNTADLSWTTHRWVLQQAASQPDRIAVSAADGQLSYGELDRRSRGMASELRARGVGMDDLVGVAMERSAARVVALLAILRAGGAYLPLDPDYPSERLAFMLEDAAPRVVLAGAEAARRLPDAVVPVLDPQALLAAAGTDSPSDGDLDEPRVDPSGLAYVCYTSGSTGRPKGVAVPHAGIVRLLIDPDWADLDRDEVFLQLSPLAFDLATFEIWGPLMNGGRSVVYPAGPLALGELATLLQREGVTTLWLTAGLFHQMVDRHSGALADLHQMIAGGDVLSPAQVRQALASIRDGWVINGYGPTENTTFTTCHRMRAPGGLEGESVPIGRAIRGTTVAVVDRLLAPVPEGEVGELGTGGLGLARGYLGRPALTAERFVPDSSGSEPGGRLYLTGDLARHRGGGVLDFLGRVDHQVKIRGFRIEPGEVEARLGDAPGVADCAVVVREDRPGEKRLVAYVVRDRAAAPELQAGPSRWRTWLGERLPKHLVPAAIVPLGELPLNPNGKVDRRALVGERFEPRARPELDTPWVAPRTDSERSLAAIWCQLLGLDEVGVDDDLFELGGHSLVATQMVARVRERLGVDLPIGQVFAAPTVARIAAQIDERLASGESDADAGGPRREPRPEEIPPTFPQQRIWFLQQLDPESLAYNFQSTLELRGDLDLWALHQSLAEIVRRHESLRTSFPARAGSPVQRIHSRFRVDLPVVDLTVLPTADRRAEAARRREQVVRRPYDVGRLPLIYWVLFRCAADDHVLLHAEHHLVHDGWSFNVFLAELSALYSAYRDGRPSPLAELPVQLADWALWQERWMDSAEAHRQLEFWRGRLAPAPSPVALPADRPRPPIQTFRGSSFRIELPAGLAARVRATARERGVTVFMTLLTAFKTLLHRYSGAVDVPVGCGIANRRFRDTERLIGMIINTVIVRSDLAGDPRFSDLLARSRQVTRDAYANQDYPLGKLVEALRPEREGGHNPFFSTCFSFHDAPLAGGGLAGLDSDVTVALPNGSAKFDLNVIGILPREQRLAERGDAAPEAVTLLWEYNLDLFDHTTARRMLAHYVGLLESVVDDPARRLSELSLLSPAQAHQICREWNDTATGGDGIGTLDRAWAASTAATPDAVALEAPLPGGGVAQITYGELDRRSARLAARLCRLGAGGDQPVATMVGRSCELVVALLAVVRAGAAYVPIDPSDPAARRDGLLRDLGVELAVTTGSEAPELPEGVRAVLVEPVEPAEPVAVPPSDRPAPALSPDALAYVMFTSGSTGRPKGVAVPHRAILRLVRTAARGTFARMDREQVWLQLANASFDASTLEIWAALLHGGRLVVAAAGVQGLDEIADQAARSRVTSLWLTAGLFHQMADGPVGRMDAVGQLLAGGDVVSPTHVRRALAELPGSTLVNGYGPTENTTFTTCHAIATPDAVRSPLPIGRPIAGTRVFVADGYGRSAATGAAGELLTGGEGLARGYARRPRLTAERFVPDGLSGAVGARLYRTGDLARWLPDGTLDFLGRADQQVKLRGFRVELGEVESLAVEHPAVTRAAAWLDTPEGTGEPRLALAVLAADPAAAEIESDVRAFLSERLPGYMVPSRVAAVDELPLGATGKVDRAALAELVDLAPGAPDGGELVAPRDEFEELLARLWSELLGTEAIGVHQSFFELGGHSLQATRMMHRVHELFDVRLPVRSLYDAPTVADLALRVQEAMLADLETSGDELAAAPDEVVERRIE